MKTTTKIYPVKIVNHLYFYAALFIGVIAMLIVYAWLKDYEDKITALESVKEACIETHPYLNREWTQVSCGRVVK
jgi:hypothetical protein